VLFPYEAYFYSSGGIEEEWGPKDLPNNRLTATVGFALGSLLAISILASSAQLFGPVNVGPETPGTSALEAAIPFGKAGLLIALGGMLIAIAGAAVETCMANAYSVAQFFGWEWGRHKKPWEAPRFTIAWIGFLLVSMLIILTDVDVMTLVEYAIIFSIVVLPLTYLPLMLLARDKKYMGQYVNGPLANGLGWLFFAVITAAAIAAIPLYLLTSGGQG
jgi:Mn2+/Fe2+ NRAMP family transporter